jgi:hypothetical protein
MLRNGWLPHSRKLSASDDRRTIWKPNCSTDRTSLRSRDEGSAHAASSFVRPPLSTRAFADIDKRLAADFPDSSALISPNPLAVDEVRAQLRPDEALVLFLDTPEIPPTSEETFSGLLPRRICIGAL